MQTRRLRAFMERYGVVGALCVGVYLALRHAWLRRRGLLLAGNLAGLVLLYGLIRLATGTRSVNVASRSPLAPSVAIQMPAVSEAPNQDEPEPVVEDEHPKCICSLAFSPDGTTVATGGADGIVRFWDLRTGRVRSSFYVGKGSVSALVFPPDGRTLIGAALRSDPSVRDEWARVKQWDLRTRRVLWSAPAYGGALALSPDARMLAVGARVSYASEARRFGTVHPAGGVQLWDLRSHRLIRSLLSDNSSFASYHDFYPADEVDELAFSADGSRLFGNVVYFGSCGDASCLQTWSVRSGRRMKLPHSEGDAEGGAGVNGSLITGIAASPRYGLIAVGDFDQIHLLNARTAATLSEIETSDPAEVAFSSDGRWLANTSKYHASVEVRSTRTGRAWRHCVYSENAPRIHGLAFSPIKNILAFGDEDGSVHLWHLDTDCLTLFRLPH